MATVKRIGSTPDIIPSLSELKAIRRIKTIASRIIRGGDYYFGALGWREKEWSELRGLWQEIKYYSHSRALSATIDSIAKDCVLHEYSVLFDQHCYERIVAVWGSDFDSPDKLFTKIVRAEFLSENEPVRLTFLGIDNEWIFRGFHFRAEGLYSDDQFRLLILEEFDKERRHFESLKQKFDSAEAREASRSRPRIPESVRIEVWRRDGGKCARCGSREQLEYDHIVPLSKGGSNTTRNIELLCEECNRRKGSNIG